MKEINLFGSFGFGNIGDEIIPQCFLEATGSTDTPLRVNAFSRYNHTIVESVIDHSEYLHRDLQGPIFVCGGGIVENHPMSCLNRAMEKKSHQNSIVPFAISVEPGVNFSFLKRLKLNNMIKRFEKIYVRDRLSSRVLKKICPNANQEVVGDLGLWCHSSSSVEILKKLPNRYFVFIPSDNWKDDNFIRWVSNEIVKISRELGCPPVILPISFLAGDDDVVAKRIYDNIVSNFPSIELIRIDGKTLGRAPTGADIAAALANSDLTISMRLHGCVISYAQKKPFVALAYHPKLQGFLETVEWEFAMSPSRLPDMQAPTSYGYRFSDMNLGEHDLWKSAIRALTKQSYHMLEEYKGIQRRVLGSIF